MTPKQQRFVEEYLVDLNATQAAMRAGYSKKTAHAVGHENLRKPEIEAAIAEAMQARSERTEVTIDKVVQELALIAFANADDFFDWGPDGITVKSKADLTRGQRAVVAEVSETITEHGGTVRVKLGDKLAALDKLARHLGMFVDKHEVTVERAIISNLPMDEDAWAESYGGQDRVAAANGSAEGA